MRKILLTCFALAFVLFSFAQERSVSGRVTSGDDGSGLPGVNVVLKGTSTGTVTDIDGKYTIAVSGDNPVLVYSFIGYVTQEIPVQGQSSVDVTLAGDVTQLSEVVVTGQGIQQEKRALGYSVQSVAGTNLVRKPEADVARLLNGKIAGVNITNVGGTSGAGTNIIIRGYTTITGSKQPLFVVDGAPFNSNTNAQGDFLSGNQSTSSRFLDIDPNNIERVDVLKGLSAAVLYGEQGKNGVILITTKNGSKKKEAFTIDFTQSYFKNEIASLPEYQNNYGNGFQQNYGAFFSNWGPNFKTRGAAGVDENGTVPHPMGNFSDPTLQAAFPQFVGARYEYKPYDNDRFFEKGDVVTTSITLGGSSGKTSYNTSVSRHDETGFIPGNALKRFNVGLGINTELTSKFSIQSSFNFVNTDAKSPPISAGSGSGSASTAVSVFGDVLYVPRSIDLMGLPFQAPDGRSVFYRAGNDIQNPRWTAANSKQTDVVNRFTGTTRFGYKIMDGLEVSYRASLDTYSETLDYVVNKGGPDLPLGVFRSTYVNNTIWNHDGILSYNKQINDDFSFTGTLGVNARLDKYKQDGIESTDQVVFGLINHDNFKTQSATNSLSGLSIEYQEDMNRYGVYGSFSGGYKDFAYITVAGRNDWVSSLEDGNNSIFYPSVSASFIPTTAFDLESRNLNYLKVRLGYATSAGFPSPYSTRSVLASTARAFVTPGGDVITDNGVSNILGNPNLKPELQTEIEYGIEAKLIDNRLGIDFTYYTRTTTDLITFAPLDPSTGYTSTQVNIGQIDNKGIELGLTGTPVRTGDLQWDLTLNFNKYRSIVKELGFGLTQVQIPGGAYTNLGNFAIEGEPFNVIQGSYVQREETTGRYLVGPDGNYVIADDIKIIGDPNPDWTSSLISSLNWKGFNFGFQIDYRYGGDIYAGTISALLARGVTKDTDFVRENTFILDGVTSDGSENTRQITNSNVFFDNIGFGASEFSIYDGTTIRLREISLGYNLPKSLLSKTPFKNVSLTFSGQNLWFNAVNTPKYMNYDPEVLSTGVGNGLGFDFLTGPSSRRYGASLKLSL